MKKSNPILSRTEKEIKKDRQKKDQWLGTVRNFSKGLSISATSKKMNMEVPTFQKKLIDICGELNEVPPVFNEGKRKQTEFLENVWKLKNEMMRVNVPQIVFEHLHVGEDDFINFKLSKTKVIMTRRMGKVLK
jgi:hypothetical protein